MSLANCSLCHRVYKIRFKNQRICPHCLGAKRTAKKLRQEAEDWERRRQPIPGAPPPVVQPAPIVKEVK